MSILFPLNTPSIIRIRDDGALVLFGYSFRGDKHTAYVFRVSNNIPGRKFEKIIDYKELILCNQDGQINFGHIRDRFQLAKSGELLNAIYLMRDTQDFVRVREVGDFFWVEKWPYSFSKIYYGDSISKEETKDGTVICVYRGGVEIGLLGPFSKGIFQNTLVSNQQKLMVH